MPKGLLTKIKNILILRRKKSNEKENFQEDAGWDAGNDDGAWDEHGGFCRR